MERVELKQYGEQILLYIDGSPVAAIGNGITKRFDCNTGTYEEVPCQRVIYPFRNMPPSDEGVDPPSIFVDVPRGTRAEAIAWRDTMIRELRTIIGTDRHAYYHGDGEKRLAVAMRDAANGFGPHFTAFFEILCMWLEACPVGEIESTNAPLAPGEPPPGVLP